MIVSPSKKVKRTEPNDLSTTLSKISKKVHS